MISFCDILGSRSILFARISTGVFYKSKDSTSPSKVREGKAKQSTSTCMYTRKCKVISQMRGYLYITRINITPDIVSYIPIVQAPQVICEVLFWQLANLLGAVCQ